MACYPTERILDLYPNDPDDAEKLFKSQQFDSLKITTLAVEFGDPNVSLEATREALLAMLKYMPPDKQKRVLTRIETETAPRGYTVTHLEWWDIQPGWRVLQFIIMRDGHNIPVIFMWKRTNPFSQMPLQSTRDWIPSKTSSIGFAIEFHFDTYQQLKASFIEWLNAPLELPFPIRRSA